MLSMEANDISTPLDFSIKANNRSSKALLNGPQGLSTKDKKSNELINRSDGPLDLSVGKRLLSPTLSSKSNISSKIARFDSSSSPWGYSVPRVLTPPKQSHKDNSHVWNGKLKNNILSTKMSSPSSSPSSSTPTRISSGSHAGRQNPWQTQWINRSSEQTRDVFTCVWCKESFRSLAEMTDHMKRSPRCGMAGMQHATGAQQNANISSSGATPSQSSHQSSSSSMPKEPISSSVLAKNNVGLPRKLVRGQDVWLGRGAEQTRQILKCMWCGQSFKTLADMTTHMRVTQHYTNIISQEQIISWRTPEDKLTQAQVNAVLTCKVCDEAFGSLKELSYHMVKNSHYKEHILRSITEGGHGRRRQTRERRKKSLPVRKLLELERREIPKDDKEESDSSAASGGVNGQLIQCDDCHEKVEAKHFISHIKLCKAQVKLAMRSLKSDNKSPERVRSPASSGSRSGPPSRGQTVSPLVEIKTEVLENESKAHSGSEVKGESETTTDGNNANESVSGFGSVLNAIEKLIEKSFDPKTRKTHSTGILQRLGIDEEVCPPWQHMPPMSWNRNCNEFFSDGQTSSRSSGHQSISSPLPHELLKENNGMSSADSSNCDSDSCNSFTNATTIALKSSGSAQTSSPKLSFPISSLISNNNEDLENKTKNLSPKSDRHSLHSPKSNSSTPQSTTHGTKSETKQSEDKISDLSDEEKDYKSSKSLEVSKKRHSLSTIDIEVKPEKINRSSVEKDGKTSPLSLVSPRNKSEFKKKSSECESFNPLMQLQKLLDKTDSGKNKANATSNINSNNNNTGVGLSLSPSLLAFSWVCSDASTSVTNTSNSSSPLDEKHHKSDHPIKCPYCEASFTSKGAFRHHFSKTHLKTAGKAFDLCNTSVNTTANNSNNDNNNTNTGGKEGHGSSGGGARSETNIGANESTHSKFLKYTELAKQLSSKYV
ncbi:protein tiptop-like isoform X2 [Oppia nitens]|nr:protein tiptop-like isoform X2 [Oppia nitens]